MKNFKTKINIIIGSISAYLSILFLAIAINSPLLAVVGLVIAPASIIYFNKKFTVKPIKYYFSLVGAMVITFLIVGMNPDISVDTVDQNNHQQASIESEEELAVDKEVDKKEDSSSSNVDEKNTGNSQATTESISKNEEELFAGYKRIKVDGGNLSGHREPNVVVDIGFGDREYWAFTNEYGQLVKVVAKQIILQDDSKEPVNSKGRYYNDEAKVPGVESKDLDEGHIIADSLGGVSNAYNITPQNSTLNRHGDQAYMEKAIRDAGGCTDFVAIITYPNTKTQIPSHYSYTYKLNGNVIKDEFDNINPDKYNSSLESNASTNNSSNTNSQVSNTTNNSNNSNQSSGNVVSNSDNNSVNSTNERVVYANGGSSTSNKYHSSPTAHNMEGAIKMTESEAKSKGYVACKRCY